MTAVDRVSTRTSSFGPPSRAHRMRPMAGRDPGETHRAATPLELLYDLTFVVAFGTASSQLAHLLTEGHVAAGLSGFGFATFAICWVWINFSWFASAYDTDDWAFRLATMVQMVGVIILALGLPAMFHSLDAGKPIDNGVMVVGYVVMRIAMISLWLRASRQDPARRRACLLYATTIGVAQLGWIVLLVIDLETWQFALGATFLGLAELIGRWWRSARRAGRRHRAHLRYLVGLLHHPGRRGPARLP